MEENLVSLQLPAELIDAELETIAARRRAAGLDAASLELGTPGHPSVERGLTGLALSGGGIRSSTFGIGVIQALARAGLFQRADYVSTVSGGGYTGSMLSSLLRDVADPSDFPLDKPEGAEEPPVLQHLRNGSNYLSPGGLLNTMRLPAVVVRGLLLNLLLILPFIMVAVTLTEIAYEKGRLVGWTLSTADARSWLRTDIWALAAIAPALLSFYWALARLGNGRWRLRNRYELGLGVVLFAFLGLVLAVPLSHVVDAAIELPLKGPMGLEAYVSMASGAFGDIFGIGQTLMQATPIIFTSLAFLVSYKAGLFNIGAEGQFLMGAIAAAFVGIYLEGLPWIVHVPLVLLASVIAGGLWGFIPAVLKSRFDAHEVITTMMLSYVAQYFTSYLVNYPLKAPGWVSQTVRLPVSAELTRILPPTQLSSGIYIAGVMVILVWFLLRKTILGYELRAIGLNPTAAENAGININKGIIVSMVLSGAIAGLGGAVEIMGVHKRFIDGFSPGYGWDGLAVALVGGLDPFGSMLASVLFGALRSGGMIMSRGTGVPLDINTLLQGLVILFVAAPTLIRSLLRRKK